MEIKNIELFEENLINLIENMDIHANDRTCALASKTLLEAGMGRLFAMSGKEGQGLACISILRLLGLHLEDLNEMNFKKGGCDEN